MREISKVDTAQALYLSGFEGCLELLLDVHGVTGSSPVPRTNEKALKSSDFEVFLFDLLGFVLIILQFVLLVFGLALFLALFCPSPPKRF